MNEPSIKRTFIFVDGQNLFHAAREAFGYYYPNYDVKLLSQWLSTNRGWSLSKIYFYTGMPHLQDDEFWHNFWSKKLSYMGRTGIEIFSREMRYHNKDWKCPSCSNVHTSLVGHEKGVDVRMALDIIRLAHEKAYDVAVIFSQDQDLSEVAKEVRNISLEQSRWIKIASAFPVSPTYKNNRGIDKTDWIKIDRATYDSCIDLRDYR